jgi:lysophospholipase
VIAGSKHEILQEQDRYRAQFWAAFDLVPGTPLFK